MLEDYSLNFINPHYIWPIKKATFSCRVINLRTSSIEYSHLVPCPGKLVFFTGDEAISVELTSLAWAHLFVSKVYQYLQGSKLGSTPYFFWQRHLTYVNSNMYVSMDALDDVALVLRLREGDTGAFEMIYCQYASDLFAYARKNIQAKEDCEEIIQDVFESLWSRRGDLHVTSLRHYLFSMVRYKLIRHFHSKRLKRRYAEHFLLFESVYDNAGENERDPETLRLRIEETIAALPERCQVAMRLRFHENLSNTEIAQRMNITKRAVEKHMYKAFEYFRNNNIRLVKG
jgi:RNA polymerase sigma-70 factor (family 1)